MVGEKTGMLREVYVSNMLSYLFMGLQKNLHFPEHLVLGALKLDEDNTWK